MVRAGCIDGLLVADDRVVWVVNGRVAGVFYEGTPMIVSYLEERRKATIAYMGRVVEERVRVGVEVELEGTARRARGHDVAVRVSGAVAGAVAGALGECRANGWRAPRLEPTIPRIPGHLVALAAVEQRLGPRMNRVIGYLKSIGLDVEPGDRVTARLYPVEARLVFDRAAGRRAAERLARQLESVAGFRVREIVEIPTRGLDLTLALGANVLAKYGARAASIIVEPLMDRAPRAGGARMVEDALMEALHPSEAEAAVTSFRALGVLMACQARVRHAGTPWPAARAYNALATLGCLTELDHARRIMGLARAADTFKVCPIIGVRGKAWGQAIRACDVIAHAAAGAVAAPIKVA